MNYKMTRVGLHKYSKNTNSIIYYTCHGQYDRKSN